VEELQATWAVEA
jgi:hypothetical protein